MIGNLLIEKFYSLMRFPAYRWASAVIASFLLAYLAKLLLGGPPSNFDAWPSEAKSSLKGLVSGLHGLSAAGWLVLLVRLACWIDHDRVRSFATVAGYVLVAFWSLEGSAEIAGGLGSFAEVSGAGQPAVLSHAGRAAVLPSLIGLLPIGWLLLRERLLVSGFWQRLFVTGTAPQGGWMPPTQMKKYVRPLPTRQRS